jgi:hypothetical protein
MTGVTRTRVAADGSLAVLFELFVKINHVGYATSLKAPRQRYTYQGKLVMKSLLKAAWRKERNSIKDDSSKVIEGPSLSSWHFFDCTFNISTG